MNKTVDWVIVGRFGRPHGVKGQISVISFTEPLDNIIGYDSWHVFIHKQWHPVKIQHHVITNKQVLVSVEGYQDRDQVAFLTNCEIAIQKSQLAALPAGEYYWHEMIGMQVVDCQQQVLGVVTEIMPTGANDVLVVIADNKRHLIPYLPGRVVLEVSTQTRTIRVDWDTDF